MRRIMRLKRLSGTVITSIASVMVMMGICLSGVMDGVTIGKDAFFICSNPISPMISDRSDFVSPCCDGQVETQALTAANLMVAMESVLKAFRAVSLGRSGELTGPETVSGKVSCYVDSIEFVSQAMVQFPPQKNKENIAAYNELLNDLNARAVFLSLMIRSDDKGQAASAFVSLKETCARCHANFR
ncbi:hypothetical protein JXA80_06850 [bacterium]|nr:hypothetical protein [candidate division CSSED10-310 bacterium]